MTPSYKAPCAYKGGKQRLRKEIVDIIFERESDYITHLKKDIHFFDICSGTGNITLEFLSRGFPASNITMIDQSSWGAFYKLLSKEMFDMTIFRKYIRQIPEDKNEVESFLKQLAKQNAKNEEEYKYLLLQAGAFGGKQIWREGDVWKNTSFRKYWQPTATSSRRSPVNPMMPSPKELLTRVESLLPIIKHVCVWNNDVTEIMEKIIKKIKRDIKYSIIYIDPPYINQSGYGFNFDWRLFAQILKKETGCPIYVSEAQVYSSDFVELNFSKQKGGVLGKRTKKHSEYLNIY